MQMTCLNLHSAYNKKYVKILLHYRWLFIKGNVIIGECGIFGVEICQFFVKGNFIIGRVECIGRLCWSYQYCR